MPGSPGSVGLELEIVPFSCGCQTSLSVRDQRRPTDVPIAPQRCCMAGDVAGGGVIPSSSGRSVILTTYIHPPGRPGVQDPRTLAPPRCVAAGHGILHEVASLGSPRAPGGG